MVGGDYVKSLDEGEEAVRQYLLDQGLISEDAEAGAQIVRAMYVHREERPFFWADIYDYLEEGSDRAITHFSRLLKLLHQHKVIHRFPRRKKTYNLEKGTVQAFLLTNDIL
jgi:hypothetical protein